MKCDTKTAGAGNLAELWAALPVSPESDLKQLECQINANPEEWRAAAEFLTRKDLGSLALGRYDLTSSGTYANVQEYDTKDSSVFEAHRSYVDIQVAIDGQELIYVAALDSLSDCLQEYDSEKDVKFWSKASASRAVKTDRKNWVVLFPSDAHMPCMTLGTPCHIKKIIVKVPFKASL